MNDNKDERGNNDLETAEADSGASSPRERQPKFRRAIVSPRPTDARFGRAMPRRVPNKTLYKRPFVQPHITPCISPSKGNYQSKCKQLQVEKVFEHEWKDDIQAQELPFFPIERKIKIDLPPLEVCGTIKQFCRDNSIYAEYDPSKTVASCTTSCSMKFQISIYEDGPNKTFMEVQRRKGCSLAFNKERQALIRAVTNDKSPVQAPRNFEIPPEIAALYKPPTDEEIYEMLEMAKEQLENNKGEGQLSTLTMVGAMTDSVKSHAETSERVVNLLVEGTEIPKICAGILEQEPSSDLETSIEIASLRIFSNILKVVSQEVMEQDFSKREVFPLLLKKLETCSSPHSVCIVLNCLASFFSKSPSLKEEGISKEVEGTLKRIRSVGEKKFLKLRDEAGTALYALTNEK